MIPDLKEFEAWFVTGSQHLYGEEALKQVAAHSEHIVKELNASDKISVKVIHKPILTTSESILKLCQEANSAKNCIGLITWMHTFSPAKMWIAGLNALQKPFVHLHTQFNRDIPWSDIDMDFMNLNQSAHGGREFGFIGSRMRINRKVIAGHWEDPEVQWQLDVWLRAACAHYDMQGAKFARFGDNMRNVAVTEGNKVSAQINFGYSVDGYGVGDLVAKIDQIKNNAIDDLLKEYDDKYILDDQLKPNGKRRESLRDAAKIELGLKAFMEEGGFKGFTDTFEDLHGLKQLPGIAAQRLMAQGYGFGAEGDWKTAALVRAMKVMASGLEGGNSFMEDYTYHFQPGNMSCLGAHMLEICESIANEKPKCEIHPLGIGGKEDPVRLVFDVAEGEALNASVVDMGNRFRMLVNTVKAVQGEPLPKLPVARVLWQPKPDLKTAAAAWIQSGGAHHTCYSQNITPEFLEDYASMCDMEFVLIDENTQLRELQKELRWNEVYYHLNN